MKINVAGWGMSNFARDRLILSDGLKSVGVSELGLARGINLGVCMRDAWSQAGENDNCGEGGVESSDQEGICHELIVRP